jgi:type II secretory ATPase GspE/PulE/Tfp pilus assembly ATPase PilB-like protein
MVVAQRLVRKLCPKCRESYRPPAGHLPAHLDLKSSGIIYKAKGCERGSKTGYLGRMAIFEIMSMTERIEQLVSQKASIMDIRAEARRSGMRTLEESGYRKVLSGDTSVEEVVRMTMAAG